MQILGTEGVVKPKCVLDYNGIEGVVYVIDVIVLYIYHILENKKQYGNNKKKTL
jgi:hypothetical protein